MSEPWICPKCGRGVAPGEKTCDHGGKAMEVAQWPKPPVMVPSVFTAPPECYCGKKFAATDKTCDCWGKKLQSM